MVLNRPPFVRRLRDIKRLCKSCDDHVTTGDFPRHSAVIAWSPPKLVTESTIKRAKQEKRSVGLQKSISENNFLRGQMPSARPTLQSSVTMFSLLALSFSVSLAFCLSISLPLYTSNHPNPLCSHKPVNCFALLVF